MWFVAGGYRGPFWLGLCVLASGGLHGLCLLFGAFCVVFFCLWERSWLLFLFDLVGSREGSEGNFWIELARPCHVLWCGGLFVLIFC